MAMQPLTTSTNGVLAATGAAVTYAVIGAWTLVLAGVALLTIVRVTAMRRRRREAKADG